MTFDDVKMVKISKENESILYEMVVNDGEKYLVCSKSITGALAKIRRLTNKSVILRSVIEKEHGIL